MEKKDPCLANMKIEDRLIKEKEEIEFKKN